MRARNIVWNNQAINFQADYVKGWLITDKRNRVDAFKIKPETIKRTVVEFRLGKYAPISSPTEKTINQFPLEPMYNCFGYCFGDSEYFIPNPTPIIQDEYEIVPEIEKAEMIMHVNHNGFNDQGDDIWQYTHGMILNLNGTVSFKPGFCKLESEIAFTQRNTIYNFNHEEYLRRR
ncbi:MAG: hypothetical protein K1X61_13305 [Chitinophagales bacterium]|nr:hypothetical protein [Chitinophagales bacterium]